MSSEVIIIGIAAFLQGLVVLYIETRLKKSIEHKFDVKLTEMEHAFSREMADRERRDKFRLAAIDERLKVHQTAFRLSRKLLRHVHDSTEDKIPIMKECDEFWDNHSLYLTKKAREVFWRTLGDFNGYDLLMEMNRTEKSAKSREKLMKAFDRIGEAPGLIAGEVDLEAMGDEGQPLSGQHIEALPKSEDDTKP